MRSKFKLLLLLGWIATASLTHGALGRTDSVVPSEPAPAVQVALEIRRNKISGGESITGKILVRRDGNTQELVFRLEHNNPSVVRLPVTQITLKPNESEGAFEIFTSTTPIKSNVTIKALLQPADQVQVEKTIEIVPALLKTVGLTSTTLNGTHGAKINCRVELQAVAPPGGVELYLDIFTASTNSKFLKLNIPNPRVPAGSRETTFEIAYDKISTDAPTGAAPDFSSADRKIDLSVGLEPQSTQSTRPWPPIAGVVARATFDLIQLRVVSASVQPNSVSGGAEALATFTLNFPPGSNETAGLGPVNLRSTNKAWARLLGSSCQGNISTSEMLLAEGSTTHSFKICTAAVTASTVENLKVSVRNTVHSIPITIQP